MKTINSRIEYELLAHGASLVGFADVKSLPVEMTGSLPRAVSIAAALGPAVIREISDGPTKRYYTEYNRLNSLLAELSEHAVKILVKSGSRAEAFDATTAEFDSEKLSTRLQHKTIATRAGLGWIGKSALLVTSEYGPAVRLASVLTDAEFEVAEPVDKSQCGQCRKCMEHCPANAILGENWNAGAPRDSIYDAFACRKTARELAKRQGIHASICGICINVCPWTQRYLTKQNQGQMLRITPAAETDYEAVEELFRQYETNLPFDLSFQQFQQEVENLPGRYAPPSGKLLLAKIGDAAVGCVALRKIGGSVCEMKRLFVLPAFQRRGVGRMLADAIIEEARRIGYKTMKLDTVLEPAKCLYKSLGFKEIPPYQHVPIEGVVFMELELM
ncbi:MAG: GNAT family N-acetyltransferase [Sedimentisphaerales bacterium]|nr:GNAT family N-acetyltransferase [Sedimentisphaerales bacterium]